MGAAAVDLQQANPELSQRQFEKISKLAYEHFGLDLSHGKQSLVSARLSKRLRELGLTSFDQYFDHVTSSQGGEELTTMVDYLTTNHTNFFREPRHFELLRKTIYPALRQRPSIQIWSAACSSGEEPYSIAMSLLEEAPQEAAAKVRIRATDISTRVLERGKRGIYRYDRIQTIPEAMRSTYLLRGQSAGAESYRFKPHVRNMIEFQHLNLMEPLPAGYTCSVLFCRNILIYFDKPTQQRVIERLSACIEEGGYLLIGHSESLNNISHDLTYLSPATYRKTGQLSSTPKSTRLTGGY
jgi:chemotaxis protein methyltransferase CheR